MNDEASTRAPRDASRRTSRDVSIGPESIDVLTGTPAPVSAPGAIKTGRRIATVRTRSGARVRLPLDERFVVLRRRTSGPAMSRTSKPPSIGITFKSPDHAVRQFVDMNRWFFDASTVDALDTADATRDYLDTIESRVGRTHVRATKTPAGRRILATHIGPPQIRAVLRYVFGRAPRRAWPRVEWHGLMDYLNALQEASTEIHLDRGMTTASGTWAFPLGAGLAPRDELIAAAREQLGERRGDALARWIVSQELFAIVDRWRTALAVGRDCIDRDARRTASRRLTVIRRWAQRPELMPDWACAAEANIDSVGACTLPGLRREVRQLEEACQVPYNPRDDAARQRSICSTGGETYGTGLAPDCGKVDDIERPLPPLGSIDDEIPW